MKTEEVGFEPTVEGYPTSVFETDAFGHSATLPLSQQAIIFVTYVIRTNEGRNVMGYRTHTQRS